MKRLVILIFIGFLFYSIYYDLKKGTLPETERVAPVSNMTVDRKIPAKKLVVKPGDTVLSIVEKLNGQMSVPIQKIIHDFKKLNPGADPHAIQIGETYLFPLYGSPTN